jgi:hypothetical protein
MVMDKKYGAPWQVAVGEGTFLLSAPFGLFFKKRLVRPC